VVQPIVTLPAVVQIQKTGALRLAGVQDLIESAKHLTDGDAFVGVLDHLSAIRNLLGGERSLVALSQLMWADVEM
jgi:hypothetical protein